MQTIQGKYTIFFTLNTGLCEMHIGVRTWRECVRTIKAEFKRHGTEAVSAEVREWLPRYECSKLKGRYTLDSIAALG